MSTSLIVFWLLQMLPEKKLPVHIYTKVPGYISAANTLGSFSLGITTWWKRTFEGLRGARMFHLFHSVRKFPWAFCLAWCLAGVWVVCWLVLCFGCFSFRGNLSSQSIPVVDRPCLALVRPSLVHNRSASSWAHWTCGGWLEQRLSLAA